MNENVTDFGKYVSPSKFNNETLVARNAFDNFFKELRYRQKYDSPFLKLEESLDILQSYTTSSNYEVPAKYILSYLNYLEQCKNIASTREFKDFDTLEAVFRAEQSGNCDSFSEFKSLNEKRHLIDAFKYSDLSFTED